MDIKKHSAWNLKTRISNLLAKELGCDVEFLVGTPPQAHKCHKVILAAGSSVFEAMFFGALRQKSPVPVPDIESRGFSFMLQYLYSDAVSLQDETDAFETAYAAKKYMISSLFNVCERFLLDKLTLCPDTVFTVLEEATFLEMRNLQEFCLRYVSRNAKKVFSSKSFVKASRNAFGEVLSLDLMNIESEREVIEALWLWGQEQCRENGLQCSVQNVRDCTKQFLKHVRFFALTMEEVLRILEKCQILDTSDELALLWNLAMPKTRLPPAVPSKFCRESKTRSIVSSSKIQFPTQYRFDGNLTSFLINNCQTRAKIAVTCNPVTLVGVTVALKPIPCYSCNDRSLEIEISVTNCSSNYSSSVKSRLKAESSEEMQQLLLLDNYVVIEENQVASLDVLMSGEGIRLMQCAEESLSYDLGKSEVSLKFEACQEQGKRLFPIKELLIV